MSEKIHIGTMAFLILSVSGLLLAVFAWQFFSQQRLPPSLAVAGLPIGGMKIKLAKEVLANRLKDFNAQKITFIYQNKTWRLTPAELGLQINLTQTLAQADLWGYDTNFLAVAGEWLESLFSEKNLSLIYSLNRPKFNGALADLAVIEKPPRNATLKYNPQTDDFEILAAEKGTIINRAQLVTGVLNNFARPGQAVALTLVESDPLLRETNLAAVKETAQNLLAQVPYFLQTSDAAWRLEKQNLADWILTVPSSAGSKEAEISFDQNKISDFLSSLTSSINCEPVNGRLGWENNELKFALLAQNGQKLNLKQSTAKINKAILAGEKNIDLVIDTIEPEVNNKSVEVLGIRTLLGRGESNFSGSPKNRKYNLALGASKLNGLLIKSGEEFSFTQNIGAIDEQAGYLPELVIKNKETIPEFGGGMCQGSTTLFRAAVNSGLKITDRHPHAYPVHYYNPPGFDATVYPPNPDLKFINDTPANILLQSKIEKTKLIFEIYGSNDGREVKIKGPKIVQSNPDGSLKTILTQEIWRAGQLERSDIFRSSYQSPDLYPISTSALSQTR